MLLEIDCDSTYIHSWFEEARKDCPPMITVVKDSNRKVSFNDNIDVYEYEILVHQEEKMESLWYPEPEGQDFKTHRTNSEESDSSTTSDVIAYNHTRRVLLHYESYKKMGKVKSPLRAASRQSSKPSTGSARKRAIKVATDVGTWTAPFMPDDILGLGLNSRVADYYIESVLDTLCAGVFTGDPCGTGDWRE